MPADTVKHTPNAPERIWATVNGMSTRLPDGNRQLIGGWSEDPSRDRVTEYVRADLVGRAPDPVREKLVEELEVCEGGLVMLRRAIEDGDPKAELLVRVGDALRETRDALSLAKGEKGHA